MPVCVDTHVTEGQVSIYYRREAAVCQSVSTRMSQRERLVFITGGRVQCASLCRHACHRGRG